MFFDAILMMQQTEPGGIVTTGNRIDARSQLSIALLDRALYSGLPKTVKGW